MPTQALPPRRPTTPQDQDDSTDSLREALGSVLGVAANVFVDRPGFVASDDEVDPLSAAVRAVTRLNCRRWASADKSGFSTRVNNYNADVCGPYLDSIGENPEGGDIGPDFLGGQCPVIYRVSYSATAAGNDCSTFTDANPNTVGGRGPLSLRPFHDTAISAASGGLCPGFSHNVIYLVTADGEFPLVGQGRGIRMDSFSVFREDGGPDNCGNGRPTYQPPATVTPDSPAPPGVIVNIPGIGPITVNVDIGPDGDPTFTLPDIGVDFGIELGGGDGGGGDSPPPGDVGSPGTPSNTGPGGDAEGEAPPGSVLTGLKVDILTRPLNPNKYTDVVDRGVCYVYMGVPGLLDQDFGGSMLRSGQFLFAEKDNLTSWRVSANNNYILRVTPYYREAP